ncbi:MAG TPA: lipopolysaccharide transport periplasmic protein LptA [Ramlibacter sp.]|nr:lipopolysaccharide transport periplasmic protein LptA [Ramlibacter sp.]
MKHTATALPLCLALMLSAGVATAEKADKNKPMNIEADALRYDDLKQSSVFTGRVVLTKGTIVIRGARVDVRQDPEGYQFGVVTADPGKLAFFRQKREGVDEFIEGEGESIEYDGKADRVKFIKHAQLRRFRGAIMNDEMVGSLITYDNSTDVFTVDGGPTSPAVGGRVRAVISPRPDASAAAPAVAPSVQLRSNTSLDGDKK